MFSYITFIVSNIVSLTLFDIFNVKVLWLSTSSNVIDDAANQQHTGAFLFDFY